MNKSLLPDKINLIVTVDGCVYIAPDIDRDGELFIKASAFNDQLRETLECACMHATLNSQCALKIGEALNLLMVWNKS